MLLDFNFVFACENAMTFHSGTCGFVGIADYLKLQLTSFPINGYEIDNNSSDYDDSVIDPDFDIERALEEISSSSESESNVENTLAASSLSEVGSSIVACSNSQAAHEKVIDDTYCDDKDNCDDEDVEDDDSCEDDDCVSVSKKCSVKIVAKKPVSHGCKQVYDKCNYCVYCNKEIRSKISRHLLTHKEEKEILEIRMLAKRCPERMARLRQLANDGNFKHNASTLSGGSGLVVVGRRNKDLRIDPKKFLPCEFCHKFLSKNNMWRHVRTCRARQAHEKTVKLQSQARYRAVSRGRWLLNASIFKSSESCLSELMNRMHDDNLKQIVMTDELIRAYAVLRMQSLGSKKVQKLNDIHRVSQSTRLLARIVVEARKQNPEITLNCLICPTHFDLVVRIATDMSINKAEPALNVGRSIGFLMNHVSMVKNGMALRMGDKQQSEEALNFKKLHKSEWNFRVNSPAVKCINVQKRTKTSSIPLTEDLQHLRQYIMVNMKFLTPKVDKTPTSADWTRLAKLTMSRLILFNKRRRAEVKDLKVKDYLERPQWQSDTADEMELALSPVDKMLASR